MCEPGYGSRAAECVDHLVGRLEKRMRHSPNVLQSCFTRKGYDTAELRNFSGALLSVPMREQERPDSDEAIAKRLELLPYALRAGSAAAFAKTVGVSPQSWSNYITLRDRITKETIARIALKYPIATDWILLGRPYAMPADILARIAEAEAKRDAPQKATKPRRRSKTS